MIALLDADVLIYRTGFGCDAADGDERINLMSIDNYIKSVLDKVEASGFRMFLSDSLENNFRFKIDPSYKSNRKDVPKPKYFKELRRFVIKEWGGEICTGQEADDALGIAQTEGDGNTVICSIDKDLYQITGHHYDVAKGVRTWIPPVEATRQFYRQLLIGDRTDWVFGIDGIGKVKAGQIINKLEDELAMFDSVRALYMDDERLLKNGRLLWIRRTPDQLWSFPPEREPVSGGVVHQPDDVGAAPNESDSTMEEGQ